MIEIDAAKVISLLNKAVGDRGADYVYKKPEGEGSCLYVHGTTVQDQETGDLVDNDEQDDWEPGCIVGYVLHDAGVPLDRLRQHEKTSADEVIRALNEDEVTNVTPAAVNILRTAQSRQDEGTVWGVAVKRGLEFALIQAERDNAKLNDQLQRERDKIRKVSDALYSV